MERSLFDRIHIPKPCHENWNSMTPNEQGAFCKVCNKSVHDFSAKNETEIEQILQLEQEGMICGRFSMEQLQPAEDLEIPFHLIPKNIPPFRAFALAIFLVFGTGLFGITNAFGQGIKGKVCIRKSEPVQLVEPPKAVVGDVSYTPLSKPALKPPVPEKCSMNQEVTILTGGIPGMYGDGNGTAIKGDTVRSASQNNATLNLTNDTAALGNNNVKFLRPETSREVLCYPNPGNGTITLSYEVTTRCDVNAGLYSTQGQFIKQLFVLDNMYTGKYESGVDLSDLRNGTYLICIRFGAELSTRKFILSR